MFKCIRQVALLTIRILFVLWSTAPFYYLEMKERMIKLNLNEMYSPGGAVIFAYSVAVS